MFQLPIPASAKSARMDVDRRAVLDRHRTLCPARDMVRALVPLFLAPATDQQAGGKVSVVLAGTTPGRNLRWG